VQSIAYAIHLIYAPRQEPRRFGDQEMKDITTLQLAVREDGTLVLEDHVRRLTSIPRVTRQQEFVRHRGGRWVPLKWDEELEIKPQECLWLALPDADLYGWDTPRVGHGFDSGE
jgi:hypothetical protein